MITKIEKGNINDVYHLKTDDKEVIIRKSKFNNAFETYMLNKLQKYELKIPRNITSSLYKSNYIMIYDYIEGDILQSININVIWQLTEFLIKLHSIKITIDEINMEQPKENLHKLLSYIKYLERYVSCKEFDYLYAVYDDIAIKKDEIASLPKCLIHSDIKKENIIICKDEVYVIDFGNCYIGTRLIDIIRVIMWLFIFPDEEVDYNKINHFCEFYFSKKPLMLSEEMVLPQILDFCLLYNYAKDIFLYSNGSLNEEYVKKTSEKWYNTLKDTEKKMKIMEIMRNAGYS